MDELDRTTWNRIPAGQISRLEVQLNFSVASSTAG